MKKGIILLAALALPVLAFAGGKKESASGSYMRLTWWGNTVRDEQTLKVAELFKTKNPGVTIDTETVGWGGYWDKLNTQAGSSSVPDVIQQDYAYIGQWASRSQLLDLTPYTQNGTIDVSGIPDSVLAGGKIDGKLYGVLLGTSIYNICYDPAIVQKAGLPTIDSKTWTLGDFERIAETIYQKTGVKTLPFDPVDPFVPLQNFIIQSGADAYSADGKKLGFTDTAVLKEFWDVQLRLLDKGALIPASEAFVQTTVEEDAVSTGKSWVKYIWNTQLIPATAAAGRPLDLLFLPRVDQYKRPGTFLKPSMFFSIYAKSENPALAAKFVNFFVNDLEANDIIKGERGVPAPAKVRDYLGGKVDSSTKIAFAILSEATNYSSPVPVPDPGASGEVRAIFRDITVQVLSKTITSAEGVTRFMTRANQILGGN